MLVSELDDASQCGSQLPAGNDNEFAGPELWISTRTDPFGGEVLVVSGELCLLTGPELEAAVERCARTGGTALPVRVDLSGVEFIDAAGLSAIVRCVKRLGGDYRALRIVAVSPPVRRVAEVTGTSWIVNSEEHQVDGG